MTLRRRGKGAWLFVGRGYPWAVGLQPRDGTMARCSHALSMLHRRRRRLTTHQLGIRMRHSQLALASAQERWWAECRG